MSTHNECPDSGQRYYEWMRTDILARIGGGAQTVLSVGCGGGVTEAELVKCGVDVTGVELQPEAAERARQRGLHMLIGKAEDCATELAGRQFDCLVFADVLEHLPDPELIVRQYCGLLRPGGQLLVSVPNFRHYSVFQSLCLRGEIQYTDAGILDRSHIRITTRKMVARWFAACGIRPVGIDYRILRRRDRLINRLSLGLLREFLATQVILTGEKPEDAP